MPSLNISSTNNRGLDVYRPPAISEKPLGETPEFYSSMANNPLVGRMDKGIDVRKRLMRILDYKEWELGLIHSSTPAEINDFFVWTIPNSTIAGWRSGMVLIVQGFVEYSGGRYTLDTVSWGMLTQEDPPLLNPAPTQDAMSTIYYQDNQTTIVFATTAVPGASNPRIRTWFTSPDQ